VKFLKQYPEFLEFHQLKGTRSGMKISTSLGTPDISTATPSKALENTCENLRNELGDELFARFKKSSPSVFERAVVELLVKMG
jgi:restriction system protein